MFKAFYTSEVFVFCKNKYVKLYKNIFMLCWEDDTIRRFEELKTVI